MSGRTNKELYRDLRAKAIGSTYYGTKRLDTDFAPMVEDSLFLTYFTETDMVTAEEIEVAIGRRLKIEELKAVPLSVPYFLYMRPLLTESPKEREILISFESLIEKTLGRYESRAVGYEIRRLSALREKISNK